MVSDPEDSYFLWSHAHQDRISPGLRFRGVILPRDLILRDPDPPCKIRSWKVSGPNSGFKTTQHFPIKLLDLVNVSKETIILKS